MSRVSIDQVSRCYSAGEVREFDRVAIDERGVAGIVLMKRAGAALWRELQARYRPQRLDVFCGKGNNAGDGYVVARLAADAGVRTRVVEVGDSPPSTGDAGRARAWAQAGAVQFERFGAATAVRADAVVDALLGTGLNGDVRAPYADAIERINAARRETGVPVVAADLPSGLAADTGAPLGIAVVADVTVTFIALKRGLLTGAGVRLAGELILDDLDVPGGVVEASAGVELLRLGHSVDLPPVRPRDAHKNRFGHLLIVGGDAGMGGAVLLAAEAALRCGAGLVSVATRAAHVAPLLARCPSAMVRAIDSRRELGPMTERADAVVIGPGLGTEAWGEQMLDAVLACGLPVLLDADALTLIARDPARLEAHRAARIITPHPGEAARLLGIANSEVGQDRFAAARRLAEGCRASVVLKGAGSLVTSVVGGVPRYGIVCHGNPGMATAGMGDVLSGTTGALLAQAAAAGDPAGDPAAALDTHRVAALAACVHAAAGDRAAAAGEIGLNAHDLPPLLRTVLNGLPAG